MPVTPPPAAVPPVATTAPTSPTGPPALGDVRLVGGETAADGGAQYGRLEIFDGSVWGGVCDTTIDLEFLLRFSPRTFTDGSAVVACRQLGFADGIVAAFSIDMQPASEQLPLVLGFSSCDGTEAALTDCPEFAFGPGLEECTEFDNVYVHCFSGPDPARDDQLRLMGGGAGAGYEYGRLEIFLRGFWSNICDLDSFTPASGQVACRALGYDGGGPLEFRQELSFGARNEVLTANLPVAIPSLDCDGDETSLVDCVVPTGMGRGRGERPSCATVLACGDTTTDCPVPSPEEGSVRLRGGSGTPCDPVHTGFAEIFLNGAWGAICGESGGRNDALVADVACRQLGFPHGTPVDPTANPRTGPGVYDLYSYYYIDYSLTGEESIEPSPGAWLDEFACQGTEESILDCPITFSLRNDYSFTRGCDFSSRITVVCRTFAVPEALEAVTTPGAVEGDVRLLEQQSISNWQTGQLEVFFEGSWGSVCARFFNGPDADVACRQLGFGAGTRQPQLLRSSGPAAESAPDLDVFPLVNLAGPGCNGT